MAKKIYNIALMAHADAGKTTITEHFLFKGGLSKKLGSVDEGTTHSDFLQVERDRGISVRASFNSFDWNGACINLIDTPGHIDFTSELERILPVIDAAILVVSAVEGIQAQTEAIWSALKERKVPVLFFINKIDRIGADVEAVLADIKKECSSDVILMQDCKDAGLASVEVSSKLELDEDDVELVAGSDEKLLETYLNQGFLSKNNLDKGIKSGLQHRLLFPVLLGASKLDLGVDSLLDFIEDYFPEASYQPDEAASAYVYAIGTDKSLGRVAYVKLFAGRLHARDVLYNNRLEADEKIALIKKGYGFKFETVSQIESGDIAMLTGLKQVRVGDILGAHSSLIPEHVRMHSPLLTVQAIPAEEKNYAALANALLQLSDEDPSLDFEWDKEERTLQLKIYGEIQTQILASMLENRFGIEASFTDPAVVYKETITSSVEAYERYWMPKPCWAIVRFKMEPGTLGSGIIYESKISVDDVHQKYQNEVERTIPEAVLQSIKGWELTDVKITLIEGEDHGMHSRPGDFVIATNMAIMNGLQERGTQLLEPVIKIKIQSHVDLLGNLSSEIIQRRGQFESPLIEGDRMLFFADMPLSMALDLPVRVSSLSGGKAKLSYTFKGYQPCTDDQGVIRPYKGINPLDRSKYILKMRKAIQ